MARCTSSVLSNRTPLVSRESGVRSERRCHDARLLQARSELIGSLEPRWPAPGSRRLTDRGPDHPSEVEAGEVGAPCEIVALDFMVERDVAGPMPALHRFCGLVTGQFGGSGRAGRPIRAAAYRARAMRRATGEASGRINLIGEHTDYNDGLVLPVALGLGITVVARPRDDRTAHLVTDADVKPREASFVLGEERKDATWADRARGVTAALLGRGVPVDGFEAEISSTLPLGAGLGSSAALAVALVRALRELFDLTLDDGEIATVAHAAETEFVGARAGLMDQLASIYGRRSEALLIDLHDLSRVAVR